MRKLFGVTLCAVFLLLVGCSSAKADLTPAERSLASAARVDPAIAAKVRGLGTSIERMHGQTPGFKQFAANGIVLNTEPKDGRLVLPKVRQLLAGTTYDAYLLDETYGYGPDKIAVLKANDHQYLALVRTDAVNYDMDHEAVMERYRQWEKKYDLKLVGAGQDWMEAEIRNPPSDWLAFAKEVYKFCPDVVDQGTGDVPALAKEMKRSSDVYLWWD
ncbi:MAG: hypothetical protein JWR83_3549 [Aeromicrobium sp.]|nr:hypothetical protein [Aeromicrobium sp.]